MAHLLQLEEFQSDSPIVFADGVQRQFQPNTNTSTEAARIVAYEQGYSAGWDDASRAAGEDQTRICTEFSHNLQDLSFTFYEAKSHVIRSLGPLLLALVEKLLPDIIAQTIGERILEEIIPLAEMAAETPIQIVVAPSNRAAIEPFLATATAHPIEISEESTLGLGQVYLRSGKFEKKIDLDDAILKITEAVSAIEQETQGAFAHG